MALYIRFKLDFKDSDLHCKNMCTEVTQYDKEIRYTK